MSSNELTRMVRIRPLPSAPIVVEASEAERAELSRRFGVTSIERLVATVALSDQGRVIVAEGSLKADLTLPCAVSGDDIAQHIEEPLAMRFVPGAAAPADEEIDLEIDSSAIDDIEYEGDSFDLGEAVAQTFGLSIDPYAIGPDAERTRAEAGIIGEDTPSGPLAEALRALRGD